MVSEAGHYRAFLELAKKYSSADHVTQRWAEWIAYEAEMVQTLAVRGDRMH